MHSDAKPRKGTHKSWNKRSSSCTYQKFEQVCLSELAQQRAEAENRHEQMASELTGFAMSRTAAEQEVMKLRKELSDANAKLKNAANAVALGGRAKSKSKGFTLS